MVKISEKLKELRLRNGLTQEALAEILGVSSQAISRWENGNTYPDINMLPSLATYFKVSVDDLLGMDLLRGHEEISSIHSKVHAHISRGRIKEAISDLRQALKLYPNNEGFLSELALALTQYQNYNVDSSMMEEAINISEKLLKTSTNDKVRSTVKANLSYVYLNSGNNKKAKEIASTLSHIWESREFVVADLIGDDKALSIAINDIINLIYSKIKVHEDKTCHISKILMLGSRDYNFIGTSEKIDSILKYLS